MPPAPACWRLGALLLSVTTACGASVVTPPTASPLAASCEAPLSFSVEVDRLLAFAAAHATRSHACVDGPGERVRIDEVLACPGRGSDTARHFDVRYRVARYHEGGGGGGDGTPDLATFQTKLRFERSAAGASWRVIAPDALPGVELLTPLDRAHDGDCYGHVGPFVPADVDE